MPCLPEPSLPTRQLDARLPVPRPSAEMPHPSAPPLTLPSAGTCTGSGWSNGLWHAADVPTPIHELASRVGMDLGTGKRGAAASCRSERPQHASHWHVQVKRGWAARYIWTRWSASGCPTGQVWSVLDGADKLRATWVVGVGVGAESTTAVGCAVGCAVRWVVRFEGRCAELSRQSHIRAQGRPSAERQEPASPSLAVGFIIPEHPN